jgi:hypothetical protein
MNNRTAALVVLLTAAGLSFGQAAEVPTLPPPQPVARPPLPSLPALAHEVGGSLDQTPEYAGLATAPQSPPADDAPERWWLRGEYLFWWVRHASVAVPLAVNESPGAGTPGFLGSDASHFEGASGGRLALGTWFDAERTWGVEAAGFFLQPQSKTVGVQSDGTGNPSLSRPVVVRDEPLLVPVSVPNFLAGALTSRTSVQLSGFEADFVWGAFRGSGCRVELLAGYRHLDLHESIGVVQASQAIAAVNSAAFGPLLAGDSLLVSDQVGTSNHFDGGQVGARAEIDCGPCYGRLSGEAGLGANSQVIRAAGTTHLLLAGTADILPLPGGVSVGATETGRFARTRASFAGGLRAEAGCMVTSHFRLFAAYSLLYWGAVVRPGDQLGDTGPVPPFRTSDFWAQGVSGGVEVRW